MGVCESEWASSVRTTPSFYSFILSCVRIQRGQYDKQLIHCLFCFCCVCVCVQYAWCECVSIWVERSVDTSNRLTARHTQVIAQYHYEEIHLTEILMTFSPYTRNYCASFIALYRVFGQRILEIVFHWRLDEKKTECVISIISIHLLSTASLSPPFSKLNHEVFCCFGERWVHARMHALTTSKPQQSCFHCFDSILNDNLPLIMGENFHEISHETLSFGFCFWILSRMSRCVHACIWSKGCTTETKKVATIFNRDTRPCAWRHEQGTKREREMQKIAWAGV